MPGHPFSRHPEGIQKESSTDIQGASSASSHPIPAPSQSRAPRYLLASFSLKLLSRTPLSRVRRQCKAAATMRSYRTNCGVFCSAFSAPFSHLSKIKGKIGANPSIWPDQRILMIMRCGHFLDWLFQATVYLLS